MKIKFDHDYMERIKYITLGFVILYILYMVISHFGAVLNGVKDGFSFMVTILKPFLWGVVIAYLMYPIVRYFETILLKIKLPQRLYSKYERKVRYTLRGISFFITFFIMTLIIFLTVYSVYVMINGSFRDFELTGFINSITDYANNYSDDLRNVQISLEDMGISTNITKLFNDYASAIAVFVQDTIVNIGIKLTAIGMYIINICFGFIFAYNFIMYKEYFSAILENLLRLVFLKEEKRKDIKEVAIEIHEVFMHFIRGRLIDLTLLSFVTILSLMVLDYDYPVLVGAFAGYTNIIPYLGSYLGVVPPMIISLVSGGWQESIFIGVYILAVQQIYIVLVSPKVQGKSINMHPVFVLLSIFIFGNLFGLIGIILCIPFGGIVKIFILRWVKKRQIKKGIDLVELTPNKLHKNIDIP